MDQLPRIIYHYTSYENFKKILTYGTIRFKLSTLSNDQLDTVYIKKVVGRMKQKEVLVENYERLMLRRNFILMFSQAHKEHMNNAFVSCFTTVPDSRLLWDAYTVNRPNGNDNTNKDIKYNGVCIGINTKRLIEVLKKAEKDTLCVDFKVGAITYDKDNQNRIVQDIFESAWEKYLLIKKKGVEEQNIIPIMRIGKQDFKFHRSFVCSAQFFYEKFIMISPLIKHDFWEEEKEIRAIMYNKYSKENKNYIDLPITDKVFEDIILGPMFGTQEIEEIDKLIDAKLDFSKLKIVLSKGTDIIRYM